MTSQPTLHGILVTYRRPVELERSLRAIGAQTRSLGTLIVVDNAGDAERIVHAHAPAATYVRPGANLGPAGGIALGMERLLERVDDGDWVFTFDDDDEIPDSELLAEFGAFAEQMVERDRSTAAVGRSGVRFDRRSGRVVRVPDDELSGVVSVDCIAGNQFPLYSMAAIRAVGPFRADFFFGFEELEFGLRLRDAGYRLYVDGPRWHDDRARRDRIGLDKRPARSLRDEPTWERYYSIRNLIAILRAGDANGAAARVTAITGIAKPLANVPFAPRLALRHLRLSVRACRDGWAGRMGRTVDPGG
jgi:GT2 family glycosyltransferase